MSHLQSDVRKYFVFTLPAVALGVAYFLWLWLPAAELDPLMAEGGAVESWTLMAYAAAMVAICLTLHAASDLVGAAAWLLFLAFLSARELDLHFSITGTSVLRVSYYLDGEFTAQKAAALAVVTLFLACVGYLWRRHGKLWWRGLLAREPVALAALAFCVTGLLAKTLDRAESVLTQDFGLEVSAVASLFLAVEELLELALPLIVIVAVIQHARAVPAAVSRPCTA